MGGWGKGNRGSKGYGKNAGGRRLGVINRFGTPRNQGFAGGFGGRRAEKGGGKRRSFLDRDDGYEPPQRRLAKGFGKRFGGAWDSLDDRRKGKGKRSKSAPLRLGGKSMGKQRRGGEEFEAFEFLSRRPAKGQRPKGYGRMRSAGPEYGVLAWPAQRKGKGKGKVRAGKGKSKVNRGYGVIATIGKANRLGGRRLKGKSKGKGKAGIRLKGKGKGRKGKALRKGKGKGKGKKVSKEFLDRQLEEYMGPDAIKAVLDEELDHYFGTGKKEGEGSGDAGKNGGEAAPRAVASA